MKRQYNKPPLTFDEQLNRLLVRGLIVENRELALSTFSTISYYRLSAYWYPFRQRNADGKATDNYISNTKFEEPLALYEFDRQLRLLVLDAIERIEVALRTKITHFYHILMVLSVIIALIIFMLSLIIKNGVRKLKKK